MSMGRQAICIIAPCTPVIGYHSKVPRTLYNERAAWVRTLVFVFTCRSASLPLLSCFILALSDRMHWSSSSDHSFMLHDGPSNTYEGKYHSPLLSVGILCSIPQLQR